MKDTLLGVYRIGPENVRVFYNDTRGGSVVMWPYDKGCARMTIGIDQSWPALVGLVLHEAFEFRMARRGHTYERAFTLSSELARYTYLFNHTEFDELCTDVGDFLSAAIGALQEAYRKSLQKKNTTADAGDDEVKA